MYVPPLVLTVGEILQLAETDDVAARADQLRHDLRALIDQLRCVAAPRLPSVVKKFSTFALTIAETRRGRSRDGGRVGPRIRRVRKRHGFSRMHAIGAEAIVEDADERRGRPPPSGFTSAPTRSVFALLNPGAGYGATVPPLIFVFDEVLPSSSAMRLRAMSSAAAAQLAALPMLCVG